MDNPVDRPDTYKGTLQVPYQDLLDRDSVIYMTQKIDTSNESCLPFGYFAGDTVFDSYDNKVKKV
jgi:hypothetical protein